MITNMDENICYNDDDDDDDRRMSSQWQLTHDSMMSLERDSSKQFLQYKNFHLHLIQKREPPLLRLTIPASKDERLCYFRNYVSSPNKTQIACLHQKPFNVFFWEYIINTLYKSLQHTYVNVFLASYVPEEHLFLSKMVPLMHGTKYCFIITGFLEVIAYYSTLVMLFDYLIGSIFLKNPWNRCPKSGAFIYPDENFTIKCYNVMDFANRVKNKTVVFYFYFYYIVEDSELLQLVQIEYFRHRHMTMSRGVEVIYTVLLWSLIGFCYDQIFKKIFWKIYRTVHWCVISMDIASFAYILVTYLHQDYYIPDIDTMASKYTKAFSVADIDFLAESTTAPPVVHVLTARSNEEILPGRDSAVIVLSNAICVLFRALLSYGVKHHCETLAKVPIMLPGIISNAWLYFWPMYFSTFFLGDIYTLFFLVLHFTMEIMTTVVTHQCLVEAITGEWPHLERWMVTATLVTSAVFYRTVTNVDLLIVLAYNKSTATLIECIVLYCMYPVYRLVDDIAFHNGTPPHFVRVQLMAMVPFYYLWKYYEMMEITVSLLGTMNGDFNLTFICEIICAFVLMLVPLLLGMVYICYKYIRKDRKSWRSVFVPAENWGPRNDSTRHLRKQYDSRTYNSSQAPRDLSRYMIGRTESKAYRLDIRYDPARRSTIPNFDFKIAS